MREKPALMLKGPGLCACGCGQATKIATSNDTKKGHVKGQPYTYIHGHHMQATVLATRHSRRPKRWVPV